MTTNYLDALLHKIDDKAIRQAVRGEVERLRDAKEFGLVFERHIPEVIRIHMLPVRRGVQVQEIADSNSPTWVVTEVKKGRALLERRAGAEIVKHSKAITELVVVQAFGEPMYPGLKHLGSVDLGGEKAHHVVVKAENYHALETLLFAYEGRVDCIYIDPPYNTGARDWKYNNDYVDKNDGCRHSKWLSFIERRLLLAKRLLKDDGVLIVTIDENEVHYLGILLEQMFPECRRPMITIVINSAGNTQGGFYRVEEHAFFCFPPGVKPCQISDDLLSNESKKPRGLWSTHIRTGGINDRPSKRPNLVYPVGIDAVSGRIVACGKSLEQRLAEGLAGVQTRSGLDAWRPDLGETVDGHPVVWPFSQDGSLGTWRNEAQTLLRLADDGFVRVRRNPSAPGSNEWSISYITEGSRAKIVSGDIPVFGRDERDGSFILRDIQRPVIPKTVWKRRLHDATNWGSPMLRYLIGSNSFDYPKSPYAVRDTLATVVDDRPNALIVDFFAGSGTTLHATCMLNAQDGGNRRSILVTNNEVGEEDVRKLTSQGFGPGDAEWEARGIYELITRPRCTAAVAGVRSDGSPVGGEYADGSSMAEGFVENVDFLELTYLDRDAVELGRAFEAIAPLLWLRAGAIGPRAETIDGAWWVPEQARYGVLFDVQSWRGFVDALHSRPEVRNAFVVTDSLAVFQQIAAELPSQIEATRLYEDFLSTFEINTGGLR